MTMSDSEIQEIISIAFDDIAAVDEKELRRAVAAALDGLDRGSLRVADKQNGEWQTNQWLKKAILLSFRLSDNRKIGGGWDKMPLKFERWGEKDFAEAGFRAVPGAIVRHGAFIGRQAVLMPSFVNIGAYVDEGAMVDSWATIGSAAQIGKRVHISGGVGIGGVLEPVQAQPVIIEDDCFIGARSEIAEGVIVRTGAVLAMGVFLSASTKIIDRQSGEIFHGEVPPYSVVISGSLPNGNQPSLYCAVIVKQVDQRTRAKIGINELLREA